MSTIYILQKDVAHLGRLTKVGMTMRSGEDRANEYGGGGWDVVDEIAVAVEDAGELKALEARIHDRLAEYRCEAAAGFGLIEVFTCSAEDAAEAARAEIGSKATDEDSISRLKKRTNRMIERKIIHAHAADLAKLHMGKGEFEKAKRWGQEDDALFRIHSRALHALDAIGADATTFREMVTADLQRISLKRAKSERKDRRDRAADKQARKEREREEEAQREAAERRKAEVEAAVVRNKEIRRLQADIRKYWALVIACAFAVISGGYFAYEHWVKWGEVDEYGVTFAVMFIAAIVGVAIVPVIESQKKAILALRDGEDATRDEQAGAAR
jgi:hypothetical protein